MQTGIMWPITGTNNCVMETGSVHPVNPFPTEFPPPPALFLGSPRLFSNFSISPFLGIFGKVNPPLLKKGGGGGGGGVFELC